MAWAAELFPQAYAHPSEVVLNLGDRMSTHVSVLVTGATGQQGGSAARHLVKNGHRVRALTRHVASAKAQALAAAGVEIVQGNLDDRNAIDQALSGMDAVFLITTPFESGLDAE